MQYQACRFGSINNNSINGLIIEDNMNTQLIRKSYFIAILRTLLNSLYTHRPIFSSVKHLFLDFGFC